jgi:hypothetical protein
MNRLTKTGLLVVFLLYNLCTYAQSPDSALAKYAAVLPQEKLYIHFDNSIYSPGQTIWYKAYLMRGLDPSDWSRNLYLSFFDASGKPIRQLVAPVVNATAAGSFDVPADYKGEQIQVLAYTSWMLNFDSAFLFRRTLPVIQLQPKTTSATTLSRTTVRFFPEGGDMVEGLSSMVAFEARNSADEPVAVTGTIVDAADKTITDFSAIHAGMGRFNITPQPGVRYRARWQNPAGEIQYADLPAAKPYGITVTGNYHFPNIHFTIQRPASVAENLRRMLVVATINQQVVFKAYASNDKNVIRGTIATSDFPSGVLRLTVFDQSMHPMAERLFFINNEEYKANAALEMDTVQLVQRGKNQLTVHLPDSMPATMSLAVTDGDAYYDSSQHIASQLLLSSELRGTIYNPAYYFSSDEDSVAQQLDLVMLTHGWRRFIWEDVLAGRKPQLRYARDSSYLSLEGKIEKLSEARLKKAETVNLIVVAKDSSKQIIASELRPDGSFSEKNLILFDTATVFYQLNKGFIPERSKFNLSSAFLRFDTTKRIAGRTAFLADTTGLARTLAMQAERRRVEDLMKKATLKEVVVTAKAKTRMEELDERYTSGLFSGNFSARQFDVVNDKTAMAFPSVLDYLRGRVAGLDINTSNPMSPVLRWRGAGVSLFLNEFPVTPDFLAAYTMSNIAYIKVFAPPFFGSMAGTTSSGGGGAISVYTASGADAVAVVPSRLNSLQVPGYSAVREFYSPDHATTVSNPGTDLRKTLLWVNRIQLDSREPKLTIPFYNNDISESFRIVLEGMTSDGRLIHMSKLVK